MTTKRPRRRTVQDTPDTVKDTAKNLTLLTTVKGDNYRDLALETLAAVCRDPDAPAAAKAQAARTLAEMEGLIGRHAKPADEDSRPASTLSRAELEAELASLRQDRSTPKP